MIARHKNFLVGFVAGTFLGGIVIRFATGLIRKV